jgi:(2Fe-2S) ferredoxin
MAKPPPGTTVQQQAETYGIGSIRRQILLCAGPDCIDAAKGDTAWNYLKKRIAELKLDKQPTSVYRTRCHCLRICTGGPIAVVQPDGVWYHSAEPEVIERILQEHVLGGVPVKEFVIAEKRLE